MPRALPLVLLLGAACSRTFSPPAGPATVPASVLGAGCADAGECSSGLCIDGVCCASSCGHGEVCNDPRALGHCRPTELGDPCTGDDRCTSGHCVDGVCCDIACVGDCQSCAMPGFVGQCTPVAENTDPRRRCAAPCGACREGTCGPAAVGTDPKGLCGGGEICGSFGACGVFDGGACASDADCALGRCLDGRCLQVQMREVQTAGMLPADTPDLFRWPIAVARGLGGQTAVLFTEGEPSVTLGRPSEHDLMLVLVERNGATATLDLLQDRGTEVDRVDFDVPIAASVVPIEGGYYVVAGPVGANYTDCQSGPNTACTVVGWFVSAGGVVGPREVVAQQAGGGYYNWIHLAALDGGLAVQFDEYLELPDGGYPEAREYNVRRDGGWQEVRFEFAPLDDIVGIVSTDTGPWAVGLTGETDLYLERLDGSARATHTVPAACSSLGFYDLAVAGRGPPASGTLLDLIVLEGCTLDSTETRPLQHLTVDTAEIDAPSWSGAEDAGWAVSVALAPGFAGDGLQLDNLRETDQYESSGYGHLTLGFRSDTALSEGLLYNALGNTWIGPIALAVDRSHLPAVLFSPATAGTDYAVPRLLLLTVDR